MKKLKIQKRMLFSYQSVRDVKKNGELSGNTTTVTSMIPTCPTGTGLK
ncbi:hypothetical protein [Pedobacter sp.]